MSGPAPLPLAVATIVWGATEGRLLLREVRAGTRSVPDTDRSTGQLVVAGTLAGLVLSVAAAWLVRALALPGPQGAWLAGGLAVMVAGVALRWWAVRTLGRWFRLVVMVEPGQRVIQEGPYRWVRHPSYTGALLTDLGFGLALANGLSIALVTLLPLVVLTRRMAVEEVTLSEALGDEYRGYMARTRRLIPGIW